MENYKKNLISFVVLNWNGIDDTLLCLDSIRKQDYQDYEIIVVDNGSSKTQKDKLKEVSDITLIDLPENTGFTGGQIHALKVAHGEYVALINNDSVIDKSWSKKATESINKHKNIAVVGGRAYSWNDDLGYKKLDEKNPFYSYQVVSLTTGHTTTLQTGNETTQVNSISGSAVLIKRSVISKIGYFDNRFFAYYEETDLFARMKRAGYKIMYSPDLKTWHKIAQSTKSMPKFYLYHMHRNRFVFATKNYDLKYLLSFWFNYNKETARSLAKLIIPGKNADMNDKMQVKAAVWNLLHIAPTLAGRIKVARLGSSYAKTLSEDAYEDVTIVIPCYNYANYVSEAIHSAAEQSVKPTSILIIDDGSKDNSVEVIKKTLRSLEKTYPTINFKLVEQKNSGVVATKNRAINEVKTKWLIFLDADDILNKDYLRKCLTAQKTHTADIVYTDMEMFGAVEKIQKVIPFKKYRLRLVNFVHNSALFRVELLRQINGYDDVFKIGFEDWELNLSLSKITKRFYYIPEPLLRYRRHEGASRDSNAQQKHEQVVKLLEKKHPELYNLRYYIWLETDRAKVYFKGIALYPFYVLRHMYYHSIMFLDKKSKNSKPLKKFLNLLRKVKGKSSK